MRFVYSIKLGNSTHFSFDFGYIGNTSKISTGQLVVKKILIAL